MKAMERMVCLFLPVLVFAACSTEAEAKEQYVYDDADLLTSEEEAELEQICRQYREETFEDYVIVTAYIEDDDYISYADSFYDENGFGYDEAGGDGSVLLIDMTNRVTYVSTAGDLVWKLSYDELTDVNQACAAAMEQGADEACRIYLSEMRRLVLDSVGEVYDPDADGSDYDPGWDDDYKISPKERLKDALLQSAGISVVLAACITAVTFYSLRGSDRRTDSAAQYRVGDPQVIASHDVFTHETVTRTRIPKNEDQGSGGNHGGGSHGGGGGHGGGSAGHF